MQVKKQPLELDMEQLTGSKSRMEYIKTVYCHPAYLTYIQSTSWEMLGWMKHKLESRLPGETSIASDMQITPPLCQRRRWHPTPVLLPGKSHGWRSLVGCIHGVAKSRTRLSDFPFTFHFHALEKEMATHSSVLAWRIPGTGEPGGLLSMESHRVGHDWSDVAAAAAEEVQPDKCKSIYEIRR